TTSGRTHTCRGTPRAGRPAGRGTGPAVLTRATTAAALARPGAAPPMAASGPTAPAFTTPGATASGPATPGSTASRAITTGTPENVDAPACPADSAPDHQAADHDPAVVLDRHPAGLDHHVRAAPDHHPTDHATPLGPTHRSPTHLGPTHRHDTGHDESGHLTAATSPHPGPAAPRLTGPAACTTRPHRARSAGDPGRTSTGSGGPVRTTMSPRLPAHRRPGAGPAPQAPSTS
ncbi:hypothetical protein ACFSJD_00660, partial [Pseudonocardia yunnanensis]